MIKKIFWNGIKVFVPIALTITIVVWLFTSIETFFGKFLHHYIPARYYFEGLGILVGVVFIFAIGLLVNAWIVRSLYRYADNLVKRIPFIKTIYNAIQDLLNYFDKSNQETQQTVLIQTRMGKVIGFITRGTLDQMSPALGGQEEVLVYIPLSYMVGGVTMVVPRKTISTVEWPVNEAMSFILTAGMTGQKKTFKK